MTKIISAWCGSGKTFICKNTHINAIEIEYWKYKDKDMQKEYIIDIKNNINKVDLIFISTDPDGLLLINNLGYEIILVYPKNELRNEYLQRYLDRDSPADFIGVFMKYWDNWLNELKELSFCKHIILESNQYLKDII